MTESAEVADDPDGKSKSIMTAVHAELSVEERPPFGSIITSPSKAANAIEDGTSLCDPRICE